MACTLKSTNNKNYANNWSPEPTVSQKDNEKQGASIGSGFQEQALGKTSDLELMRRLWRYMAPYKLTFLFCLLLLPLLSGLELIQPYLLQVAIDDHLVPKKTEGIGLIALLFVLTLFGRSITQVTQVYFMQKAGQRALYDLRREIFDHVQTLSTRYFHKNPIGRLMTRMTTDVESLQEALSSGMITMLGDFFTLGAIVVILLIKDVKLALISFTVVPPLLILTAVFRHLLRKAFREIRVKIAKLNAHLQESITGMSIIQLSVRERVSTREYKDINQDYRHANILSIRYDAMLYALVEAVGSITIGAIIWYGSGQVLQDAVTLGVLVAFIEYMQKFFIPIRDLAQKYNLFQSAMASSERIFQLLDSREQIEQTPTPVAIPDGNFKVEFENVWFAYHDEEWILQDVSFTIEPCEKIAIVGHTGAGKSTLMNLLLRMYDVTRGRILVNGMDIRQFDVHQWRAAFAVVLQDSFLFKGSIEENIALGDPELTEAQIVDAAKTVCAHELISRYDDGYAHEVSERGGNLSAGERQLLSFARALAHQPEVLLLDEATANVDTETEALIQQALDALLARQTSVVIAHRLSTIRRADRILVLHKGTLLEQGSHEDLLAQGGHYHTLYQLQYAT